MTDNEFQINDNEFRQCRHSSHIFTHQQHSQSVSIPFVRVISTGHKRPLEDKDLWALNKYSRASYIVPKVKSIWNHEQMKCNR